MCTDRTVLAWPECHRGLSPGSGALEYLVRRARLPRHLTMYVLLTGASLNPHDCIQARLATHYVRGADNVLALCNELRRGSLEYFDVPLGRRAHEPPSSSLACLYAEGVTEQIGSALRAAFGDGIHSASDARLALNAERARLGDMLSSCGWHTRERAEGVLDVLDGAAAAMQGSDAAAVAATFDAVDEAYACTSGDQTRGRSRGQSGTDHGAHPGADTAADGPSDGSDDDHKSEDAHEDASGAILRALELRVHCELAERRGEEQV